MLFYKKIKQNEAIIRFGIGGTKIVSNGKIMIFPFLHQFDNVDLSKKYIEIKKYTKNALITKDHKYIEAIITFVVYLNNTEEDILTAVFHMGSERTFMTEEIKSLFYTRFDESLKKIAFNSSVEDFTKRKARIKTKVLNDIGRKHYGYIIEDMIIEMKQ